MIFIILFPHIVILFLNIFIFNNLLSIVVTEVFKWRITYKQKILLRLFFSLVGIALYIMTPYIPFIFYHSNIFGAIAAIIMFIFIDFVIGLAYNFNRFKCIIIVMTSIIIYTILFVAIKCFNYNDKATQFSNLINNHVFSIIMLLTIFIFHITKTCVNIYYDKNKSFWHILNIFVTI